MNAPRTASLLPGEPDTRDPVYAVSELNAQVRARLESGFGQLWVEGELSNLAQPASGHWYFSLKDSRAQVRCAMFRQNNMQVQFRPESGQQVRVRVRVSLYEARGEYQLVVQHMEPAGEGALRQAFEELKNRLQAEGLFNPEHKRSLPWLPRRIGVITSPTGAAIRDVLHVLRRRFPAIPVVVYPVPVQGEEAPGRIVEALHLAAERSECDVLILTRGGGSLEDLWSFNDEAVARAVHACPLPIVAGVGHEIDFTIADFVADLRAPTPSAAAEAVTPDRGELAQRVQGLAGRLQRAGTRLIRDGDNRLRAQTSRMQALHPGRRITEQIQRLDELWLRMDRACRLGLRQRSDRLRGLYDRLHAHSPARRLQLHHDRLAHQHQRLEGAMHRRLDRLARSLAVASRGLSAVSPLATLDRGYAIARQPDGTVVTDARQVHSGDPLNVRLARGELLCDVRETRPVLKEQGDS